MRVTGLYVSKIKILADVDNKLAHVLKTSMEELGYINVTDNPEIYIMFLPLEEAIKEVASSWISGGHRSVMIDVTNDGNYVIPILNETRGGSIIGGLVADLMGAQLILTSRTAQLGLASIYEFAWINGLEVISYDDIDELDKRLISKGKLSVFLDVEMPLRLLDGYHQVSSPKEADIVIGDPETDGVNMRPLDITVGLVHDSGVPEEVIYFSVTNTLKSLNLNERRINFVVVPGLDKNRDTRGSLGRKLGASTIFVEDPEVLGSANKVEGYSKTTICESLLQYMGTRVVLRGARRAYGVVTCLGVK